MNTVSYDRDGYTYGHHDARYGLPPPPEYPPADYYYNQNYPGYPQPPAMYAGHNAYPPQHSVYVPPVPMVAQEIPTTPTVVSGAETAQLFKCFVCGGRFQTLLELREHIVNIEIPDYRPCECRPCGEMVIDQEAYQVHCFNSFSKEHEFVDHRNASELKNKRDSFRRILSSSLDSKGALCETVGVPVIASSSPKVTTPQVVTSTKPNDENARSDSPEIVSATGIASRGKGTTKSNRTTSVPLMKCQLCGKMVSKQQTRSHIYLFHIKNNTVLCPVDDCAVAFKYSLRKMRNHIKIQHPNQDLKPRNQRMRHSLKAKYLEPQCFPELNDNVERSVVQPEEMQLSSGEENSAGDDNDSDEDRSSCNTSPVTDAGPPLTATVEKKKLMSEKGADVNQTDNILGAEPKDLQIHDDTSKKRGRECATRNVKPVPATNAKKQKSNNNNDNDDVESESPYESSDNDDAVPTPLIRKSIRQTRNSFAKKDSSPSTDSDNVPKPMANAVKQCRMCPAKASNQTEHVWFHLGKDGHARFECRVKSKGSGVCAAPFYALTMHRQHIMEEHPEKGDAKPKNNEQRFKKEFVSMRRQCFGSW